MPRIICFGEILWDCLPDGDYLGGAPFNVAYHLKKLGQEPAVVSAVGHDEWGRQALARIHASHIDTRCITEHADLPTGTVQVTLDKKGNASYVFTNPAAWDRIATGTPSILGHEPAAAIVYGTLALRHEYNRRRLAELLAVKGPLRVFDVNLRAPYDDIPRALELAAESDLIKLNDVELAKLADEPTLDHSKREVIPFLKALEKLARRTGVKNICLTRGSRGAIWLHKKEFFRGDAPKVVVADTVGAGDAFTATLVAGLVGGDKELDRAELLRRCCLLGSFVASQSGAQPDYVPDEIFAKLE